MDNTYYNQQMENKGKAIKAINDYMDCLIYATPEFREQIRKESFTLFVAKFQNGFSV